MITRFTDSIYLETDECKLAYVKGRTLFVERHVFSVLTFACKNAGEANTLAKKINETLICLQEAKRCSKLSSSSPATPSHSSVSGKGTAI